MTPTLNLNTKQREAVEHGTGPLLILAGAGSGKTRVLIERIIHLIDQKNSQPWNILAVTFTNKAAREMKSRIFKAIGPLANDIWMSTFHSMCLRILRRYAEIIGFDKSFVVYDDSDQRTLVKRIVVDMGLNDKYYKPSTVQYHINKAKNDGIRPNDFSPGGDFFLQKIKEIYIEYQKQLNLNQAMDFGDLIVNVLLLFSQAPDVLADYQNKFKHVMVDEYQDTNKSQYQLIKLLGDKWKNISVVGDDDQSIYKFRGAEIRNILEFQRDYPDAKVIRLEQNYRSTQNILNAANSVIRANSKRMGKELWTQNGEGNLIKLYGGHTDRDEAIFVCDAIKSYKQEYGYGDMAIFYRTNAQSRSLEDQLRKEKIPYRIFGGIKFYDRAEIKDVMAYLKALVNPSNGISLKRILNVPLRGIGKTTVQKIDDAASFSGVCFWDVLSSIDDPKWELKLSAQAQLKLQGFVDLINKLNKARAELPMDEFLTYLYDTTGYWKKLSAEKTIEAQTRQENLTEFSNVLDDYLLENEDGTLEEFLDQISLSSDIDNMEEEATDFVNLMTVHLAKGLEFPIVFLVGLEEGLFPHIRSFDNPDDLEEERRICYVGMTRAKETLHMSFVQERRLFGSVQYQISSRFLDEVPSEFVEKVQDQVSQVKTFSVERMPRKSSYDSSIRVVKRRPSNEPSIDYDYSQSDRPFKRGARVRHSVFGEGKILLIEGQADTTKVTVEFNRGLKKKLLLKHANLMFLH